MVCNQLLFVIRHDSSLLLWASHNALQGICNLLLADLLQVAPGSEDSSLIHQVLKICSCEACSKQAVQVKSSACGVRKDLTV